MKEKKIRKLKVEDVQEIRKLLAQGMKQKDIAALYNVLQGTISKIKRRYLWRAV